MYFLIFNLNGKNLCGEPPRNSDGFYANHCYCQFGTGIAEWIEKYRKGDRPDTVNHSLIRFILGQISDTTTD